MKDTFYFSHDYEPTSDPKIQALLGEHGAVGYGIYWRIIEMLHSDCNHKLPFKKYLFLAIAKQMLTSAEQIEAIIQQSINVYELFNSDAEYFWSNRVLRNFERRAELSEKRSVAGKAGAIAKQNQANTSKGKKRKGKNIIRKSIKKEFTPPLIEDVKKYFTDNGYKPEIGERAFKSYSVANWIDSKGNSIINWKQKMINVWFRPEHKIKQEVLTVKPEYGTPGFNIHDENSYR